MRSAFKLILSFVTLMSVVNIWAAQGFLIANPALNITPADVKLVFLGEKQMVNNVKVTPLDNQAAQGDFLADVLKMDVEKYQVNWTKRSFQDGLSIPSAKASDADVIAAVKSTPGGVSYVKDKPDESTGVKVVGEYKDAK